MVLKVYQVLRCAKTLWCFENKYGKSNIGFSYEIHKKLVEISEIENFILGYVDDVVPSIRKCAKIDELTEGEIRKYEQIMDSELCLDIEPIDRKFFSGLPSDITEEDLENITFLFERA